MAEFRTSSAACLMVATIMAGALGLRPAVAAGPGGELTLEVIDRDTKEPLPVRMHLWNEAKRALKAPKVPFWHDHFVFDGQIVLKLPKGEYTFEIEHGPEYLARTGRLSVDDLSRDAKVVDLKRFVNMAEEGWWSGDLDVERPPRDMELLMRAEDLHMAQLVTWPDAKGQIPRSSLAKNPVVQVDGNRFYHLAAGRDARAGGTLALLNLQQPLDNSAATSEFPSILETLTRAKAQGACWVEAAKPYSWDLPVWVASGQLDGFQLASRDLGRQWIAKSETAGRPRDKAMFIGPTAGGRWAEAIYYHLLNCGLRITPTAGSGSGGVNNPLGYNRVYVQVDGELAYDKWFEGLRQGRVVVTNGPLIRPSVEGHAPGHVFRGYDGDEIELEIALSLSTRDRVSYLQVVRDGEVEHEVRLTDWADSNGRLPKLKFKQSGWFLIRAVTEVPETYRFATTGPYYVQIGETPRVSKTSVQFFLDWLDERAKKLSISDAQQREVVMAQQQSAREFWKKLLSRANAE